MVTGRLFLAQSGGPAADIAAQLCPVKANAHYDRVGSHRKNVDTPQTRGGTASQYKIGIRSIRSTETRCARSMRCAHASSL
ncbi:Hypothetical protein NTJ_06682 [Nesidiocoris tenuis]|uniref:Uncharacterized protein n=1 Tax=Nesidiocoris tenuis TaxID=355587 RepID=A0ABN7ASK6_9HEMI|nr:Hypothetical protein NTJ_06682 [Nesidiocoris tenuis]